MNVIVTGASRGIGKELASLFALNGHQVLAVSRNMDALGELASDSIHVAQLDLSSSELTAQIDVALAQSGMKHVDILVNNAGYLVNKPFTELTREDIHRCYQVNVMGVMELTQQVIGRMGDGSHCVNISSMGGYQGSAKFPGLTAYSSSKAAIASLTECLAEEYKESGIRFNCLALGAVQTEMLAEAFSGYEAPLSAAEMAQFIYEFALGGGNIFNGKILPVSVSTP